MRDKNQPLGNTFQLLIQSLAIHVTSAEVNNNHNNSNGKYHLLNPHHMPDMLTMPSGLSSLALTTSI